jgi:hypothetical protein
MLTPSEATWFAPAWKRMLYISLLMALTTFAIYTGAPLLGALIAGFTGYMAHAMFPAFPRAPDDLPPVARP